MQTPRHRQVEQALADQQALARLTSMDEDELVKLEGDLWQQVQATYLRLEPVVLERIARRVREHVPEAGAIHLEATDQGGPGWWFRHATLLDGSRLGDGREDDLLDDDDLSTLLTDLGEFISSESTPSPYELVLPHG